jgi:hypothetical protein
VFTDNDGASAGHAGGDRGLRLGRDRGGYRTGDCRNGK